MSELYTEQELKEKIDMACSLTAKQCADLCKQEIRKLEEREKKLVDMIRKYCVCSSMYSSAGDCSFCTNLKELGINNE